MIGKRPPKQTDFCTKAGAMLLAAMLDAYWHGRGYPQVQHWVEPEPCTHGNDHALIYRVRSNLVRGMPPPV